MRRRWRLDLAFDGSGFSGWQVQPGRRTVQGEVTAALERVGERIRPVGAGRTDSGVHALAMVAHVDLERDWTPFDLGRALRSEFPPDLTLRRVRVAPKEFHARFDARSRTYHYALSLSDNPFFRLRRWMVPVLPASPWIRRELESLESRRDWTALSRGGGGRREATCRVLAAHWHPAPGGAVLEVTADRFLYGMVRALAGTLVRAYARGEAGGHLDQVLDTGRRESAGEAAPPQGLYLTAVAYEGESPPDGLVDRVVVLAGLGAGEGSGI